MFRQEAHLVIDETILSFFFITGLVMKSNKAEIAVSMKLGKCCANNLVQSLIQINMSSQKML